MGQFTMHIEKPAGTVKMHGFGLGTDIRVAENFVLERLLSDPEIVSIALRENGKLRRIYDYRDNETKMYDFSR